jgi:hypothetical protein
MTTVYADVVEVVSSIGMNAIVAIGFYISYKEDGRSVCYKCSDKSNANQGRDQAVKG